MRCQAAAMGVSAAAGGLGKPCPGLGCDIHVDVCKVSPQDLVSTIFLAFLSFFLTNLPVVAAVHDPRSIFFLRSDFKLSNMIYKNCS